MKSVNNCHYYREDFSHSGTSIHGEVRSHPDYFAVARNDNMRTVRNDIRKIVCNDH